MMVAVRTKTGGQIVVDEFINHAVQRVYCVPGESYLAVIDALFDVQDTIHQITCRHESGAGMMALAEAELTSRPAVCFVTRGPGATNVSIAVHIAHQASVPLVLCVGQVASDRLGRESFQEMDYEHFFGSTTKGVFNIATAADISKTMREAFSLAKSGRPGPVVLVFPEDVLRDKTRQLVATENESTSQVDVETIDAMNGTSSDENIALIEASIAQSERPVIIAGGSQWSEAATQRLKSFAERNNIPVLTAFRRNDLMDNRSPSFAGYLGLNQHQYARTCVEKSDCVLVIGARLDEPTTADYTLPGIFAGNDKGGEQVPDNFQWIHIYPEFKAIPAAPSADIRLEADAGSFLSTLSDAPLRSEDAKDSWVYQCRSAYENSANEDFSEKYNEEFLDLPVLMRELLPMLPDDAVITMDAGNFTFWPQRFCQFARPGRMLAPVNGAMGYGVPSGIAASLVHPERTVVTFVGDGGMMMTGMELATAMKYGAKPIIIVFNNGLYGTIDSHQQRQYPGRTHGNQLRNPNFGQFAESFGAAAVRVKTVHDFANAFIQAKQLGELTLIELMLHSEQVDHLDDFTC